MGEAENKNIKIIIQNIKSTQVTLSFILWVTFYDTGRFFQILVHFRLETCQIVDQIDCSRV